MPWFTDVVLEQEVIHVKTSQMCAMLPTHVQQWVHVKIQMEQQNVPVRLVISLSHLQHLNSVFKKALICNFRYFFF